MHCKPVMKSCEQDISKTELGPLYLVRSPDQLLKKKNQINFKVILLSDFSILYQQVYSRGTVFYKHISSYHIFF